MEQNPIYARLVRHSGWPSLQSTVVLYVLLVVISLVAVWVGLNYPYRTTIFLGTSAWRVAPAVLFVCLGVVLFVPPLAGAITAAATAQDVQGDAYRIMLLSDLSAEQIVQGYLWAALYRLRVVWAVAFTPLPLLLLLAWYDTRFLYDISCLFMRCRADIDQLADLLTYFIIVNVDVLLGIGFSAFAVLTAIVNAVAQRSHIVSIAVSAGLTFVGSAITFAMLGGLAWSHELLPGWMIQDIEDALPQFGVGLIVMLILFIAARTQYDDAVLLVRAGLDTEETYPAFQPDSGVDELEEQDAARRSGSGRSS